MNREGYLYLLFEHKSYQDKGISLQLLKYMVEIWEAKRNKEKAKELPIIIPLVIFHGQQKWKQPSSLAKMLNGYDELPEAVKVYVPNFEYLLYDLSIFSDEDIKGSAQTRIMVTLLRDILTKTGDPLRQSIYNALYYLNDLEDKQTGVGYLETMMRYIFSVAQDLTETDVQQMIQQLEYNHMKGSELAMTLAEMWRDEGMQKGMQKGLEKGIDKGRKLGKTEALSEVALLQLTNKLGALPQDMKDAISQADLPTLQLILTNIFSIKSLDEVRRYIH